MFLDLLHNVALLVSLAVGLHMLGRRFEGRASAVYGLVTGLLFGAVGVVGMMTPIRFAPGVIYDGRSIVLSLSGLFGGPTPALISALICGAYRWHLGGAGAAVGVAVLVESAALGVALYYLRRRSERWVGPWRLLLFGGLVHAVMLGLQLLIPGGVGWSVLHRIGPGVMVFYPLGFLVAAQVFLDGERRRKSELVLQRSEERFRELVEMLPETVFEADLQMNLTFANQRAYDLYGYTEEDFDRGLNCLAMVVAEDRERARENVSQRLRGIDMGAVEYTGLRPDGSRFPILIHMAPIVQESVPVGFRGVIVDIAERKRHEEAILRQQRVIALNNRIANGFLTSAPEGIYGEVLDVVREALDSRFGFFGYIDEGGSMVGASMTRDIRDPCRMLDKSMVFPREKWGGLWGRALIEMQTQVSNEALYVPAWRLPLDNALAVPIAHRDTLIGLFVVANKSGGYGDDDRDLLESAAAQTAPVLSALLEKSRRERDHEELEQQYRQSQKMEAVGQLTGGVAHDFNNLLQVINGATEMALTDLAEGHPVSEFLRQVAQAGDRAARLVQQLLLFSRRQVMRPEYLDVNAVASDLLEMLGRVIGENIRIVWAPGDRAGTIHADRGMFEQALMNLCLNARDAMQDGGILTIATEAVRVDDAYCASHSWAEAGRYAVVSVTDTGCGMDRDVQEHMFEPFFTTKGPDKGTGLGLATVYGIVKQHGGLADVCSEPGQGTVFRLYWPLQETGTQAPSDTPSESAFAGGTETILLAEDDAMVRNFGRAILERAGYTVVVAQDGSEALALFQARPDEFDMAILDVVMPRMGGREAYGRMRALRPGFKALFASGYSGDAIHTGFVLHEGLVLVQKPFTRQALLRMVRQVLGSGAVG